MSRQGKDIEDEQNRKNKYGKERILPDSVQPDGYHSSFAAYTADTCNELCILSSGIHALYLWSDYDSGGDCFNISH